MLELCNNMDEDKDNEDFQEETIREFLKPRICLERFGQSYLDTVVEFRKNDVQKYPMYFFGFSDSFTVSFGHQEIGSVT